MRILTAVFEGITETLDQMIDTLRNETWRRIIGIILIAIFVMAYVTSFSLGRAFGVVALYAATVIGLTMAVVTVIHYITD